MCQVQHMRASLLPEGASDHPNDLEGSRMIHGFPSCLLLLVLLFCLLSPNFLFVPVDGPCSSLLASCRLLSLRQPCRSVVPGKHPRRLPPQTLEVYKQTGGEGAAPPVSWQQQDILGANSLRNVSAEGAAAGKQLLSTIPSITVGICQASYDLAQPCSPW